MSMRRAAVGLLICLAPPALPAATAQPATFTIVARTNVSYPGLPAGTTLLGYSTAPTIGPDGTVGCIGSLSASPSNIVFSATAAGPVMRARAENPAPGGSTFIGAVGDVRVLPGGDIAFAAGTEDNGGGLFRTLGSTLIADVREGQAMPGLPPGIVLSGVEPFAHVGSHMVFAGSTGPSLGVVNGTAAWLGSGGSFTLLARSGAPLPGFSAGPTQFVSNLVANAAGDAVFVAFGGLNSAIYRASGGQVTRIAGPGSAVPGYPHTTMDGFFAPSINSLGTVAFYAIVTDTTQDPARFHYPGIWLWKAGALAPLAIGGSPAPGTEGVFSTFGASNTFFDLADNDFVAFSATISGPGITSANNRGIWAGKPGALTLIARTGSQAPGYGPGVNFAFLNLALAANTRGQVVFQGIVTGGNGPELRGIFFGSPTSPAMLLARGRDPMPIVGGPAVTPNTFFFFDGAGGQDGQCTWFNDLGQFVFRSDLVNPNNTGAGTALIVGQAPDPCYANCDGSTAAPVLNAADFTCFLQRYAAGDPYANCDGSVVSPSLNVADLTCFLGRFATGCP